MSVLLCKPGDGVWAVSDTQERQLPCRLPWPCAPCVCDKRMAVCCQQSRECLCLDRTGERVISRMPCVPGICETALSPCGRYLYQLSSEADCIHTRCCETGELLYASPAGVFPRCMKLVRQGEWILCAGGLSCEAMLLNAPQLTAVRRISTPHPCFSVEFWREGLVVVCAAEGDDIQTVLYTLKAGETQLSRLLQLPGPPGGLCVCPDGCFALLSTRAGLARVELHTGRVVWNCPEWALCMRLECRGKQTLISDTLDGGVWMMDHERPWIRKQIGSFADSQACLM